MYIYIIYLYIQQYYTQYIQQYTIINLYNYTCILYTYTTICYRIIVCYIIVCHIIVCHRSEGDGAAEAAGLALHEGRLVLEDGERLMRHRYINMYVCVYI